MRVSSRPISSPGRTEKFPPSLMRFLKTSGGSKSGKGIGGSRSRASPIFARRKNGEIDATTAAQEDPSSPKVTCIGQVRVRRPGSKKTARYAPSDRTSSRHCWWVRKAFSLHGKLKWPSFHNFSRKWVSFFRSGFRANPHFKNDTPKAGSNGAFRHKNDVVVEEEADERYAESRDRLAPSPPPKNALLLIRCRSAPYRSSSLAGRFWGSPLTKESEETGELETKQEEEETEVPLPTIDRRGEGKFGNSKWFPGLVNGGGPEEEEEDMKMGESRATRGRFVGASMLTRCKSEPARTGDRDC